MEKFLILFAGGGVGTICRFLLSSWVMGRLDPTFPYGTLVVNLLGCFLIGLLVGLPDNGASLPPSLRLLLVVGFLGGFTTFSSYAFEAYNILEEGFGGKALLYMGGSMLLGLLAVWMGGLAMRLVLSWVKGV